MLDDKDYTYENDYESESYEFSAIPYESFNRELPPFIPIPGGDNFPTGNYPPGFNYPGGNFNPPGVPKSPPPNYMPSKNDVGVQSFTQGGSGISAKSVSANSIRFCLYKYTYIWERNGRSYWAFLLNIDRRSVSGFRWRGRNWVYFGVDLRRIDSFVCYRSSFNDECISCKNLRQDDISLQSSKKEYSSNETRDVYSQTLAFIDIPEVKEDFITQTIGYVDDKEITSEVPCVKARNIGYRITLEVSYSSDYDTTLKNKINEFANECSNDAYNVIHANRGSDGYSNPLENFNSSLALIPEALRVFSNSFTTKLKSLDWASTSYKDISYSIRQEKNHENWKPYIYNHTLL